MSLDIKTLNEMADACNAMWLDKLHVSDVVKFCLTISHFIFIFYLYLFYHTIILPSVIMWHNTTVPKLMFFVFCLNNL